MFTGYPSTSRAEATREATVATADLRARWMMTAASTAVTTLDAASRAPTWATTAATCAATCALSSAWPRTCRRRRAARNAAHRFKSRSNRSVDTMANATLAKELVGEHLRGAITEALVGVAEEVLKALETVLTTAKDREALTRVGESVRAALTEGTNGTDGTRDEIEGDEEALVRELERELERELARELARELEETV